MATADGFEIEDLFFGVGALSFYDSSFLWRSRIAEIKHLSTALFNCVTIEQKI